MSFGTKDIQEKKHFTVQQKNIYVCSHIYVKCKLQVVTVGDSTTRTVAGKRFVQLNERADRFMERLFQVWGTLWYVGHVAELRRSFTVLICYIGS